jgi:hypothetical protein
MKAETIGQPQAIAAGPPLFQPTANVVKQPGQDRDDRERDGEVREARPGSAQLLLVAEFGEPLFVLVERQGICHFHFPLGVTVPAERP